jgi:hypothetical protein
MSQKRASSLISQGNCMKKNVEFIEVVVNYNRIKLYVKVIQNKWKGRSIDGPVSQYKISKLEI